MTANTRQLGINWINGSISPDSRHPCDESRFKAFISALQEEQSMLDYSDIESLIIECDKKWCEDSIEVFSNYWYEKYESLL